MILIARAETLLMSLFVKAASKSILARLLFGDDTCLQATHKTVKISTNKSRGTSLPLL